MTAVNLAHCLRQRATRTHAKLDVPDFKPRRVVMCMWWCGDVPSPAPTFLPCWMYRVHAANGERNDLPQGPPGRRFWYAPFSE
jgi:hypothetical protein